MNQSYLERYKRGEYETVWLELVALGPAIRQEPLYSEAQAVAREMMQRARYNLALLIERLRKLGYRFDDEHPTWNHVWVATHMPRALERIERYGVLPPASIHILRQICGWKHKSDAVTEAQLQSIEAAFLASYGDLLNQIPFTSPIWDAPSDRLLDDLAALEQEYGPLPLVLRTWYEVVGEVSLLGHYPKPRCYDDHKPGLIRDPLVIFYDGDGFRAEAASQSDVEEALATRQLYFFEFAPAYDGGDPRCLKVPNPGFDGPLISEDGWGDMFFVAYLRECFAWGGFPGLKWNPQAAEAARAELAFLTQDLLPF